MIDAWNMLKMSLSLSIMLQPLQLLIFIMFLSLDIYIFLIFLHFWDLPKYHGYHGTMVLQPCQKGVEKWLVSLCNAVTVIFDITRIQNLGSEGVNMWGVRYISWLSVDNPIRVSCICRIYWGHSWILTSKEHKLGLSWGRVRFLHWIDKQARAELCQAVAQKYNFLEGSALRWGVGVSGWISGKLVSVKASYSLASSQLPYALYSNVLAK